MELNGTLVSWGKGKRSVAASPPDPGVSGKATWRDTSCGSLTRPIPARDRRAASARWTVQLAPVVVAEGGAGEVAAGAGEEARTEAGCGRGVADGGPGPLPQQDLHRAALAVAELRGRVSPRARLRGAPALAPGWTAIGDVCRNGTAGASTADHRNCSRTCCQPADRGNHAGSADLGRLTAGAARLLSPVWEPHRRQGFILRRICPRTEGASKMAHPPPDNTARSLPGAPTTTRHLS